MQKNRRRGLPLNLRPLLEALPPQPLEAIRTVASTADAQGLPVYLVGGIVRDLLLGRPNLDIDLVVEADAVAFATRLAQEMNVILRVQRRFGTAKLFRKGLAIDIVTARTETYPHPGSLPVVEPGTIEDDLFRRDFTINAMAVSLNAHSFGELRDPFGGEPDLKARLLRILHDRSFTDDATRIFRGLRYEERLGFSWESHTAGLLRRDAPMVDTISGDRLRRELELIFKERQPENILCRACELGVLQQIHPALKCDEEIRRRFRRAREQGFGDDTAISFSLLAYGLGPEECRELQQRLRTPGAPARAMGDALSLRDELLELREPGLPNSRLHQILGAYSVSAIKAVSAATDDALVRQRLELYLTRLRFVKPSLTGEDVLSMKALSGPELGGILKRLRAARLDGEVQTPEEEIAKVRQWLTGNK